MEFTEEQIKILIPLVKIELGRKAQDYTNWMIARNRNTDLLDTIEDKEYHKDKVQVYEDGIRRYTEFMDILEKEMEILEQIIKQLNNNESV